MKKQTGTLAIALREGDSVTIGDQVLVVFAKQMSKRQIKLVFKAPKEIKILRHSAIVKEEKI